ncbi:hypothetical protein DL768_000446 [Monosporascus sp. mg162]|nr:hypothetical protein DL768_000446 [Monosporascus sp. mg162]
MLRFTDLRRVLRLASAVLLLGVIVLWLNPGWTDRSVHEVLRFAPDIDISNPAVHYDLCRQHGYTPFEKVASRKVYDLIMINVELDWLEIRLNTTYDYVDHFVIVESKKTFTNRDKPLVIKENMHRFAAYSDKIIYHELVIPEGFHSDRKNPAWAWEDLQRDAMYKQVFPKLTGSHIPLQGDVIVVADVDEIIRPQALVVLRACNFPRRLTLRSHMYYYSFQFLHKGRQWGHPQATYYRGPARTIGPVNLRNSDGGFPPLVWLEQGELWSAGWHCSTCFSTIDEVLTKMASFSHIWLNQDVFRDPDRIADRVRRGVDLWDRPGEEYERIDDNRDVPQLLLDKPERYMYMLDRDGPSAGFKDYPRR